MSFTSGLLVFFFSATLVFTAAAQNTPRKQLTARELFYAAVQTPSAAPAKPPAKAASRITKALPKPVEIARADTRPPGPRPQAPATASGGGTAVQTSAPERPAPATASAPASGAPALGLRYTILKVNGDTPVEVTGDTVFHAGDRIRFSVESNAPGYLYIISQGSSGTWKPMFPSAEVDDGSNHVEGWHPYTMPPKSRIAFDDQTGTENLFIVLSRQPEPELERMIYSLQGKKSPENSDKNNKPEQPVHSSKELLMAANMHIDDATVGRMRATYARDLIIEKVDANTPGDKKETAVYVVNPSGSSDSRVVADLHLVHQ
jgi:hypothetical protein